MSFHVLIVQMKRLGDLIVTAPVVASIRAEHPGAKITLAVLESAGELAREIRGVDQLLVFRRFRPNLPLWSAILTQRFDVTLDLTGNDRSALLTALSRATWRTGYAKRAGAHRSLAYNTLCHLPQKPYHIVDYHLKLAEAAGLNGQFAGWGLADVEPSKSGERYVLVHPGTTRPEKYWRPEAWAEVIDHTAAKTGLPVVITLGANGYERAHVERIVSLAKTPVKLVKSPPLNEFFHLVAGARLVLSVDTVAAHIAAAAERPQVVLFGPINPFYWRPRHRNARIVLGGYPEPLTEFWTGDKAGEMEKLETRTVLMAIEQLLPAV